MPFIVRVLAEDVRLWEEYSHEVTISDAYLRDKERTGRFFYHLKQDIYHAELNVFTLKSPAQLESLVDQDMFLFINVEKTYLSKTIPGGRRVMLRIEYLDRKLQGNPRRLRLKIDHIETRWGGPPKIFLVELGGKNGCGNAEGKVI